jgi:hypothetical protein
LLLPWGHQQAALRLLHLHLLLLLLLLLWVGCGWLHA